MKALAPPNPAGHRLFSTRILRRGMSILLVAGALSSLTGCLAIRRRTVSKTVRAPNVLDATLDQLLASIADQNAAVQTIFASVEITPTTGGHHEGEEKLIPAFAGYVILRKPNDLRVFMQLPVVRSLALDMVSDGRTFKLFIPPKNKAIVGSDQEVATPSKNGLENLRPYIIHDALLIPEVLPDEYVGSTQNARILPPAFGRKESTEEPDYDLTVSRLKSGHVFETVRVIHIGRVSLKPYEQDIYDHAGQLVTVVTYDKYERFGDVVFPTSILITRPLDEYTLKIDITKLTLNQKIDDEQFVLKIPDTVPVTKM